MTVYRGRALPVLEEKPGRGLRFFCPVQGWFPRGESWCCPRGCGPRSFLEAWPAHLLRWLVG